MAKYAINMTAAVTCGAATAKYIMGLITPATRRASIRRLIIGAKSVTTSHVPGIVEFVQFTTDGTGTAVTPSPLDSGETAALCSAKVNYTVAPNTGEAVRFGPLSLSPQGVTAEFAFEPGTFIVPISRGTYVRCTFPDAQDVWATLEYEE